MKTRGAPATGEGGFAMIAVLLVLTLIALLGAEFAYSMRLEARAARNYKDTLAASHLAEAAVENAIREIVGQGTITAEADDGLLTFYTNTGGSGATGRGTPARPVPLKRLPREAVPLGGGQYSYRITDESARLNVNTLAPARLDRLLQLLDVEKQERDVIVASIQDWIDDNDTHRANGAESDDYYLELPVPYRARNANLDSITELLQIRGITPALFYGTAERPGLVDLLTVYGQQVNINTASKPVLLTLGLSDAEILEIEATRREVPYTTVGRFTGRGLTATTRTYRIEALGILDGKPRARLTTVVEVSDDPTTAAMRILSWSGIR
jgi:general secretion pathway protein K